MRIAMLAEGGYPYARGEGSAWCDRLVRGLARHEFEVYALTRTGAHGTLTQPPNVTRVRSLRLYGPPPVGGASRRRGLVLAQYRDLAGVLAGGGESRDRFATALYGLAELARGDRGVPGVLRSEQALGALEDACRGSGGAMGVSDLLIAADLLERALRPMSARWYHPHGEGLARADLCHAVSGGAAVLPGLLAKRFFGTPLLVTEYGVRLRETLLAQRAAGLSAPVRALLTAFHRLLAEEAYRQAALITPGNAHARRWQERGGADRARIRVVYPGMDHARLAPAAGSGGGRTLVWVGRMGPAKDLAGLLQAFAAVRAAEPGARLRIVGTAEEAGGTEEYPAYCRALAARLFPGGAGDAVSFGTVGSSETPGLAEAYGSGDVVVLSSMVEGFPVTLVEAMFCGRATVSTDVGAVREVIGGTGLVVPPRDPAALAAACLALLRDPERRARLGAAGRERALELFTVEQNLAAFRDIYLDLVADPAGLASPAEIPIPGHWHADHPGHRRPAWAHESACVGAARQEDPA
ncbi:GT4 family glycosyltransferase PelF [Actinacidiphila oryziradicis]|uniref:D-inositol 3-phosphate glycosyltransferase n=1 Tax=Actinacidiphila oryziradicis TaxID=2571141 RepID=A0A4U0SL64_9ACTN|nr:GT4 family glycosyltransferase PelF [Actinacidiphila oryziradicis]TKA10594.1 DUF3492 domain-containing protein [Actinacidiphila oryziradicis]